MSRRHVKKPTEAELEILQVLWAEGPATVKRVHESLGASKTVAYTSVLKTLQIMTDKELVDRDASQRAHVYRARQPAEHTKRQLAGDVLQRVFEGSASDLMMHALAGREVSAGELAELRRLIDDYREGEE